REEGGDDRLTPERLAELRRIAEAATPGPWRLRTDPRYDDVDRFVIASDERAHIVETTQGGSWTDEDLANARYIVTFDPPTVLDLLDEIERLRRQAKKAAELVRSAVDWIYAEEEDSVVCDERNCWEAVREMRDAIALLDCEGGDGP